jgi:hypothetical protein
VHGVAALLSFFAGGGGGSVGMSKEAPRTVSGCWRGGLAVMGDIGEEITEIELEPLPPEMPEPVPEQAPAGPVPEQAPAGPVPEPVPG